VKTLESHRIEALGLEAVFARRGWLKDHPPSFRSLIIHTGVVLETEVGATIFREGDQSSGLYGVINGACGIEGGHPRATPMMGHILRTGDWFGIKAPLHGGPRELTYRVIEPGLLLFLPNTRLLPLMRNDPEIAIRVGQLAEMGNRLGSWVSRDLMTPDAGRRLAAVLFRALGMGEVEPDDPRGFALTHKQLGEMANLSRHHVGRKLASFEAQGWIVCGYNRIRLVNADALAVFAYADEEAL
jgi:CRP/FNR family transcriptional regulator, cyclic AMP receptor protein